MKVETLKNQLLEVVNNGVKPTPELLKAIELCEGDDEFILGAKEYLRDFGPKELSDIKSMIPNFRLNKSRRFFIYKAAAILIVALSVGFWYNCKDRQMLLEEEGTPVFMGDYNEGLNDFMNAYRTKNYDEVVRIGSDFLNRNTSDTVQFFLGCALVYCNDFNLAIKQLTKLPKNSRFFDEANYQIGYAYYCLEDYESALFYLKPNLCSDSLHAVKSNSLRNLILGELE